MLGLSENKYETWHWSLYNLLTFSGYRLETSEITGGPYTTVKLEPDCIKTDILNDFTVGPKYNITGLVYLKSFFKHTEI